MKEFDYELDYKNLDFTDPETRKLYRIGRGERSATVRPYTNDICAHWRFVDEHARNSSAEIYSMFLGRRQRRLHWYGHGEEVPGDGFYEEICRYANHASGRKYDKVSGKVRPQEKDYEPMKSPKAAAVFKKVRDLDVYDQTYKEMRKEWRSNE